MKGKFLSILCTTRSLSFLEHILKEYSFCIYVTSVFLGHVKLGLHIGKNADIGRCMDYCYFIIWNM